jgi:hypothetical protein
MGTSFVKAITCDLSAKRASSGVRDDAILEACRSAWHFLINDPERIRSIGTREWATVNV